MHLIKHCGQRCFHSKRLLYFVSTDERILTIFQEAWALMFAHKFDECGSVGLPIHRETFQIFERGTDPETGEQGNGIFGIFVKISVENPLIHEIRFATDVKEDPSQVVKSERGESERIGGYGVLYCFSVRSDHFFATRFDFSNNREAIVGRSLWEKSARNAPVQA